MGRRNLGVGLLEQEVRVAGPFSSFTGPIESASSESTRSATFVRRGLQGVCAVFFASSLWSPDGNST